MIGTIGRNVGKTALGFAAGQGGPITNFIAGSSGSKAIQGGLLAAQGAQGLAGSAERGRDYMAQRSGAIGVDRNTVVNTPKKSPAAQMMKEGGRRNNRKRRQARRQRNSAKRSQSRPKGGSSSYSSSQNTRKQGGGLGSFSKAFSGSLGTAAGGALAALAIGGAVYGANKLYNKINSQDNWDKIVDRNPDLNTNKDRENYAILLEYAPSLTKNPKVAASYLIRAREQHLMPHEFIKDLVSITKDRQSIGYGGRLMAKAFK